jgi:hypothetical protein
LLRLGHDIIVTFSEESICAGGALNGRGQLPKLLDGRPTAVIAGLDPAIHHFVKDGLPGHAAHAAARQ